MNETVLLWVFLSEALIVGAILVVLPSISRSGLLFGIYVGESAGDGDAARAIRRGWRLWVGTLTAAMFLLAAALGNRGGGPISGLVAIYLLCVGAAVLYVFAHRRARTLAAPVPQTAAAPMVAAAAGRRAAIVTIMLVVMIGGLAIVHAAAEYGRLPDRVPTHFGFRGEPDAWAAKSAASVFLLPVGALVMGLGIAGVAVLTASAKRAIRYRDSGISVEAQNRFRGAMTLFLCGTAMSTTVMMAALSVSAVRIGLGEASRISAVVPILTLILVAYALGGCLYMAFRMGQGGSRLERGAAGAPLLNGLADNSRWKWGLFYVNPEDPSILVEKRFGLGYTINFGNRVAVLLLAGFLVVVAAFVMVALLTAGD